MINAILGGGRWRKDSICVTKEGEVDAAGGVMLKYKITVHIGCFGQ